MTLEPRNRDRRHFLGLAAAAPLVLATGRTPAAQEILSPDDPQAQALGYVEDAADVDTDRFGRYEPGQVCAGCSHFRGSADDERAGCPIFGNRLVAASGWCSAWASAA